MFFLCKTVMSNEVSLWVCSGVGIMIKNKENWLANLVGRGGVELNEVSLFAPVLGRGL